MVSFRTFKAILNRFLSNSASPTENDTIEKWYSSLDQHHDFPKLQASEEDMLHQKDLEEIQRRIKKRKSTVLPLWPSLSAAAAVIFGVVFIYKFAVNTSKDVINMPLSEMRIVVKPGEKFFNDVSSAKEIWLTDSSSILLQPNSLITVAKTFNRIDRNVVLTGEAYFDISRNERKPFNVFTYDVVTKVLGTSFTIKAPSDKDRITVVVQEGKVSVSNQEKISKNQPKKEVILTPNQQVTFYPDKKSLETSVIEKPVLVVQPDVTKNEYDEERIIVILADIQLLYGIEISYNPQILKDCKITTAFTNEGLYQRLNILTKAIGATYKVEGTRIVVNSNGCQLN
jgi:ferric-dicitrate binding protein FerR (iron transport regulator)